MRPHRGKPYAAIAAVWRGVPPLYRMPGLYARLATVSGVFVVSLRELRRRVPRNGTIHAPGMTVGDFVYGRARMGGGAFYLDEAPQ